MTYEFKGFGNGATATGEKLYVGFEQNAPITVWRNGTVTVGAVPMGLAQPVPVGTYYVQDLQAMALAGNVFAGDMVATALRYLPKAPVRFSPVATTPYQPHHFTASDAGLVGGGGDAGGDTSSPNVVEAAGAGLSKWWYIGIGGAILGVGLLWWMANHRGVHANPAGPWRRGKRRKSRKLMSAGQQRRGRRRSRDYFGWKDVVASRRFKGGRRTVLKRNPIGRAAPPKGYPRKRSKYGWPAGYMYPLDTKRRVRSAASRFAKHRRRYPARMRATIAKRLDAAKRRFRIGPYR